MRYLLRYLWLCVFVLPENQVLANVNLFVLNKKEVLTPGSVYTLFIRVENEGKSIDFTGLEIVTPAKWTIITESFPKSLEKDAAGKVLITFRTPEEERSGSFELSISIHNATGHLATEVLNFSIIEVHSLDLQVIEKPSQINGAGPFQCRYLITNTGNMREEIELNSRAGKFEGRTIHLDAWESQSITIECVASDQIVRAVTLIADLQAKIQNPDTAYGLNIPIPFFPTKTLKVDKYFRFPLTFSGTIMNFSGGKNTVRSARYNVQGQGYLDRQQRILLGLLASGPNQYEQARFGQYDQYSLNLAIKSIGELHLGDLGVSLSPLTEYSRFGRGLSYKQILGPVEVSGFHVKPRFFPNSDRMYGFKGKIEVSKKLDFQANWLNKNYALIDGKPESVIKSIATNYNGRTISFSMETAQSEFQNKVDYATQAQFDYSGQSLQLSGNFLYAGPDFTGYYNNSLLGSLSARYSISDKLSFSLSGTQNESNPQQDTLSLSILPKYTYYSTGVHYRYSSNQTFSLQMLLSRKKDRIKPVDYNFYDRLVQGSYYHRDDVSELSIEGSFGKTRNFLISSENDQEGNSFRSNIYYGHQVKSQFRLGGQIEFINTNKFTDQHTNQQLLFYGARINYRRGDQFFLAFNYRSNFPLDELFQPRSFVDGEVNYRLSQAQNLSASAGYSIFPGTSNLKQFFLSAKYEHTLNIPLKKVLNLGGLRGRLTAQKDEKISGIRLSVADQEVVTDLVGNFEFNDLPLGQNFLHIHPSSLRMNEITKTSSPIAVEIKAQEISELEIEVLACSAINGVIVFEKDKSTQSDAFVKQRPKIFLKVQNENSTFYTNAGEDGKFQFLGLRPGSWKLTVLDSGWATNFEISSTEQELTLASGQAVQLEFALKPKVRRLKFSKKTIKITSKK